MRWIVCVLVGTSLCLAQPADGPYLLFTDSTGAETQNTFLFIVNDSTAHVFHDRFIGNQNPVLSRFYSLAAHSFTTDERVHAVLPIQQRLVDVKVHGEYWAFETRVNYLSKYFYFGDAEYDLYLDAEFYCAGLGQMPRGFSTSLMSRAPGEWSLAWYKSSLGVDGEPSVFCGKVVNFSMMYDAVAFQQLDSVFHPRSFDVYAYPLDSDSFAVFNNCFSSAARVDMIGPHTEVNGASRLLDSGGDISVVVDCEWLGGSDFRILGRNSDGDAFYAIDRDVTANSAPATLIGISSPFEPTGFCRVPRLGWAFVEATSSQVRLVKVDTMGVPTSAPGTVVWRDDEYEIQWAKVTTDSAGQMLVYYGEVLPNAPNIRRVQYVMTEWLDVLPAENEGVWLPTEFSLTTYPNPFNSSVRIDYELPRARDVALTVHNTLGQEVATLFSGRANAGTHTLNWSPETASGVYFVKLASSDFTTSRKILYIR